MRPYNNKGIFRLICVMNQAVSNKIMKKMAIILMQECIDVIQEEFKKKKKRIWTRKWILRRPSLGASSLVMKELYVEDPREYKNCLRMSPEMFEILLNRISPLIQRSDTFMRDALPARLKLEITLTFIVTGCSYRTLQLLFRVSKSAISALVPEVCDAISECLKEYFEVPNTKEDWKKIENGFRGRWNFPGCYGAIDGKHVPVRQPPNSGSDFYNYKGTNSIILLAIVDHDYCFWYTDIGANGRASDGGVFQNSTIFKALENNLLPKGGVLVADDAFPLKPYIMKPFSRTGLEFDEKIYNYRLSRARRIVENAFGILTSRFRVFEKPINCNIKTVDKIIRSACTLHNWLRQTSSNLYLQKGSVDEENIDQGQIHPGTWRMDTKELPDIQRIGSNNFSKLARDKRNYYKNYFVNEGAVDWQNKMVFQ